MWVFRILACVVSLYWCKYFLVSGKTFFLDLEYLAALFGLWKTPLCSTTGADIAGASDTVCIIVERRPCPRNRGSNMPESDVTRTHS